MSAPTTNVEKQKSRHAGVLRGLAAICVFVVVIFGIWYAMATTDDPTDDGAVAPASTEASAPASSEEPAAATSTD